MLADPISTVKYNITSRVDHFIKENEKLELLFYWMNPLIMKYKFRNHKNHSRKSIILGNLSWKFNHKH